MDTPASDARTLREDSPSSHIDIVQAEDDFHQLERSLSRYTQKSTEKHAGDLEKADAEPAETQFNLREYLSSSNDANAQAGIKHKHVGVTWEDLEVIGVGGIGHKIYVETFKDAIMANVLLPYTLIQSLITPFLPKKFKKLPTRTIIHKNSGILKPGEMCLVLGCPGSGCSTFLRTIANERASFASVTGDVRYAGISHEEMGKQYKGEVVYNQEDDTHIATLTVAQTLEFALSTKTPGPNGRIPGVSRKDFNNELRDLLLRMLNISHTSGTLVGDEFVRGVSGGERKRVSIAEMMTTRARVQSWDNSTRGLDASTALDLIKGLRVMTDVLGQTTFVSLYQAGEGIYELFDKVMVIDQGRQVYYGPPSEARAYFEGLGFKPMPRQSTADYLTGCTDPNERQYATGRSALDVPSSPQALEHSFHASPAYDNMMQSLEKYKARQEVEKEDQEAFRAAVLDDKKKGVSKKSPYTLGFAGQIWSLTRRQFQMRLQDRFQLFTSFALTTVLAIVLGAAFLNLPPTAAGGFTRGGLIFSATLTAALDAFGEIPVLMMGRPILWKQSGYGMYRRAALPLANTLSDIPFSAARILIYNIIIYFMVGLDRSGGGFWTFHLFAYGGFLAIQGFFRTFGMICANFDVAIRVAILFVPSIIQYSGYMIPVFLMKRWLFWIYYINPFSYVFAALMENEFSRLDMTCEGAFVVPRNPPGSTKYPSVVGPNQACTLFGAQPGSQIVRGTDYVNTGFQMNPIDLWRLNLTVLIGWFIFFQITQLIAIEYLQNAAGGGGVAVYAQEDKETKELNEALVATKGKKKETVSITNKEDEETTIDGRTFTWEKVDYTVPVPGGTRKLLNQVYGYVKPGTMTALMGSSGAGKTTCLDVLAQRKNIGVITGDLLVDGRPLDSDFARGTAYAEQMDVHEGTTTVREALRFSAYLRQPFSVSEKEKDAYVEEVLELLELQDLADAIVFSLGVEARKRLTIGVELASKPELLLFLDEPTSGLDAQSAWNIVRFLRKLADSGQAILCTIHQPSALLFESFDRLLLLQRGGGTVYFGDIGSDAAVIRDYFARYGAHCPDNANPAEYMLEAIGAGLSPRVGDRDWAEIWTDSPEYAATREEIARIKADGLAHPVNTKKVTKRYATPFFYQLKVVAYRTCLALWRSPGYVYTRLFMHAAVSLIISLSFLQLGNSARDLQSRIFAIFWVTIVPALIMGQLEPLWIFNRRTFIRESHSRIYSPEVFALSQLVSELPYSVLCAFLYWVLMVYPIGFGQGTAGINGTGIQFLVILFMELFGVTLGQLIGAISPSIQVAVLANPFIAVVLTTFCGVTIPFPTMPTWSRSWLYYLDPYTRTLAAMVATELHGLKITCKPDEFNVFNPPSGDTCQSWAGEFVSSFGGYLDNANDTTACRYCQYSVGDEFFLPLNISYDNRWRDVWILFAFFIFNFIVVVIASKFLRFAKR